MNIRDLVNSNIELLSTVSFIPSMASAIEIHPDNVDKRWLSLGDSNNSAKKIWREFYYDCLKICEKNEIPANTENNYFLQKSGKSDLFLFFVEWFLEKNGFRCSVNYDQSSGAFRISQGGYPCKYIKISQKSKTEF